MIIRNRSLLSVLVLGLGMGFDALAELTVIYDNDQTHPLAPLLNPLLADEVSLIDPAKASDPNPSPKSMLGPAALSNLLPVRSPGLEVGGSAESSLNPGVMARLAQGNPRPLFLIGSDTVSLQWLASHRDTLRSLGAVGMLVQADTEDDVRRVVRVAQGLSITLSSGSDLAAVLGIHRYPVLITRDGIRQ